jgi:hypothetical protein
MKYAIVKYVDKWTGIPCDEQACYSPSFPKIKGLELQFANKSQWPTSDARYYISCDEDADLSVRGVIKELTEDEFNIARDLERDAYAAVIRKQRDILMIQAQNRLDRALRQEDLGEPHEPIHQIQHYMRALANVPQQENFPWEYTFPDYNDFSNATPNTITMRQARLSLLSIGLLVSVEEAIANIEDEKERMVAQTEWNTASVVRRTSPWVIQLSNRLGLDEDQLDELFKQAVVL